MLLYLGILMRFFAFVFCLLPLIAIAADPNKPHDHRGRIKPDLMPDGAPKEVPLSDAEKKTISAGTPIYKQTGEGSGGHGVAVFKVNASPKNVWKVISDFKKYPKWINHLTKAEIYKQEGDKIFVEFTISALFTTTTYYIEHNYPMEKKGWGTWTLDYSRLSDLDESIGFWRVNPVEGNPHQAIVFYSVDVHMKGIASLIKGLLERKGLREATQWVKIEAEKLESAEKGSSEKPIASSVALEGKEAVKATSPVKAQ